MANSKHAQSATMNRKKVVVRKRAPGNRTLDLSEADRQRLTAKLLLPDHISIDCRLPNGIVNGDCLAIAPCLRPSSVDLLILDPPYNLNRKFGGQSFKKMSVQAYTAWLDNVLDHFLPTLKPTATVYICGDWLTSASIFEVASRHLIVRNRITWER